MHNITKYIFYMQIDIYFFPHLQDIFYKYTIINMWSHLIGRGFVYLHSQLNLDNKKHNMFT